MSRQKFPPLTGFAPPPDMAKAASGHADTALRGWKNLISEGKRFTAR
jgi:hypothetical protein